MNPQITQMNADFKMKDEETKTVNESADGRRF